MKPLSRPNEINNIPKQFGSFDVGWPMSRGVCETWVGLTCGNDLESPPTAFESRPPTAPQGPPASLPARFRNVRADVASCSRPRQEFPVTLSSGRESAGACGEPLRQNGEPHRVCFVTRVTP